MSTHIELLLENLPSDRYGVIGDYSMVRYTGAVTSNSLHSSESRVVIYDTMYLDPDEVIKMLKTMYLRQYTSNASRSQREHEVVLIISNDWWILDTYTRKTLVLDEFHISIQPRFSEYIIAPLRSAEIVLRPKIIPNCTRGIGICVKMDQIERFFPAGSKTELVGSEAATLMFHLCNLCDGLVSPVSPIMTTFDDNGRIGVFSPESINRMDETLTPMQIMQSIPVGKAMEILSIIGITHIDKKIGFHKSRRAKSLLAYLLAMSPEVLILDRTTHYFDLIRCNILADYLQEFRGTLICRRLNRGIKSNQISVE